MRESASQRDTESRATGGQARGLGEYPFTWRGCTVVLTSPVLPISILQCDVYIRICFSSSSALSHDPVDTRHAAGVSPMECSRPMQGLDIAHSHPQLSLLPAHPTRLHALSDVTSTSSSASLSTSLATAGFSIRGHPLGRQAFRTPPQMRTPLSCPTSCSRLPHSQNPCTLVGTCPSIRGLLSHPPRRLPRRARTFLPTTRLPSRVCPVLRRQILGSTRTILSIASPP